LKPIKRFLLIAVLVLALPSLSACEEKSAQLNDKKKVISKTTTPVNFKVAFFGDLGTDKNSMKLLRLVKDEGTEMVIHLGDIDYDDDPAGHAAVIDRIFGADFPYIMLIGNHDEDHWYGHGGYQELQEGRLRSINVTWTGELGIMSTIKYKGFSIVMVSPGITGWNLFSDKHAKYLKKKLKDDTSAWKICAWHKNQHKMQVSRKGNATGWRVYDECRKQGAIIVTGHSHTYSRSYLLDNIKDQKVSSKTNNLEIAPGKSFVVVSGLGGGGWFKRGGSSFSGQYRKPTDPWWASVYTADQGAKNGALFCEFNKDGNSKLAKCYFKNIDNEIIDQFTITNK
jgi:predicted phosphodiesterase